MACLQRNKEHGRSDNGIIRDLVREKADNRAAQGCALWLLRCRHQMGNANEEASALEKLHDPKFIIRRCVDAVKTEAHSNRVTALGIFVIWQQ